MVNGSSNVHVTSYVKMLNFDFPLRYLVILYILCIHSGLFICAIKKIWFYIQFLAIFYTFRCVYLRWSVLVFVQ